MTRQRLAVAGRGFRVAPLAVPTNFKVWRCTGFAAAAEALRGLASQSQVERMPWAGGRAPQAGPCSRNPLPQGCQRLGFSTVLIVPCKPLLEGSQEARAPHSAKTMRSNPLPQGFGGSGLLALPCPACQPQSPTALLHRGQRRSQDSHGNSFAALYSPRSAARPARQGLSTPQAPPQPVASTVAAAWTTWLCLQAKAVQPVLNKARSGMRLFSKPQEAVPLVGEALLHLSLRSSSNFAQQGGLVWGTTAGSFATASSPSSLAVHACMETKASGNQRNRCQWG